MIWFMENTKIKSDYLTAFQSILENSKRKPNKIWTNQGSEFYNTHFKKWFKDNNKKCIQHIMKESLLFLKDLLEL